MVEQSHAGEGHGHTVLITALDDQIVADGAAGLGDILDARLLGALDVVAEGEEGIRAEGHAVDGVQVGSLLLTGEGSGLGGEVLLPVAVGGDILLVLVDVAVDHVIAVGATDCGQEGEVVVVGEVGRIFLTSRLLCPVLSPKTQNSSRPPAHLSDNTAPKLPELCPLHKRIN